MNKRTLRIAGWALGLSLAFGAIGTAVGASQAAPIEAAASETVYSSKTLDCTAMSSSHSAYNDEWEYGDFKVYGGANNKGNWGYIAFGAKKSKGADPDKITAAYVISPKIDKAITKVQVINTTDRNYNGIVNLSLDVSTVSSFSTTTDSVDLGVIAHKTAGTHEFTPTSGSDWGTNKYYRVNIDCTNQTTSNGMVSLSYIKFFYEAPDPVTSLETSVDGNAMNIGSSDDQAHSITVTINGDATDKKINIAHQSGTSSLFTLGSSQITATGTPCSASFTITGTGATSGTEVFRISSNSKVKDGVNPDAYVDLAITAVNDALVYCDVFTDVAGYSLTGTTHAPQGTADIDDIVLIPGPKFVLPNEIEITGEGVTSSDWDYDPESGAIFIYDLKTDMEVEFNPAPASIASISASGQKTSFVRGDAFSFGGKVDATYADDYSTVDEIDGEVYSIDSSNFNSSAPGVYTITISAPGASKPVTFDYDVTVSKVVNATIVDELDVALTGVVGSSYASWSDKTSSSKAVYAGQSSAGGDPAKYIQLRNSTPSGIVTTASGGTARKIVVSWDSSTTNARYVTIFGKASAYSEPADLYDSSKKGTSLGTITKGSTTELEITGNYSYIGILASAAVYINSIDITWEGAIASAADVAAVDSFIEGSNGLHFDHTTNDMSCKNEGWYSAAKTAFASLSKNQQSIILTSSSWYKKVGTADLTYADAKARLAAWAEANNEVFNTSSGTFALKAASTNGLSASSSVNNAALIVAVIGTGLAAAGGLLFLHHRHRKED